MRIVKTSAIFALAVFFSLSPLNPQEILSFINYSRAAQEISGSVTWNSDRTISEEVILRPGSTLTIEKGVTITFNGGYIRSNRGFLSVEGTVKEREKIGL